ncbi:hypothetical protein IOK49_04840 [Fervidicoccus fontis]|uniref:ERCC4-type nuclease n=3 Tax=Fervidicoccus fontis TaxID=683846 RepID=I0A240_FERFK|nr:ERCC4 domain-containing protein [Fervidicoccus fontis]AFH43047.1 ERCC4-type nuclease [Fervidicoccus fontis Kam940]MBE9391399.1 hypothetical protein [Fervidicoccus fontis]
MTNITLLMPTDVIMDENEKATNPEIFEGLIKGKLSVAVKQLEAGDYLLLSKKGELPILVERKTAEDFVNSIIDGRIWKQSATLKKIKERGEALPVIVLEGNLSYTLEKRKISETAILRTIDELVLNRDIPVIYTLSKSSTISWLIAKARSLGNTKEKTVFIYNKKKAKTPKERVLLSLSIITGTQTARKLLTKFGTIRNIANLTVGELMQIEGIGEVKAKKIYELFNLNYDESIK